jgi:dTDP-4-dehydrorhamnose reductase
MINSNKKIIITGSSGIIGSSLKNFLKKKRYSIILFQGTKQKKSTLTYSQILKLNSVHCLIHLAGKDDYNSISNSQIAYVNYELDNKIKSMINKLDIKLVIFSSTNMVYEGSKKSFISEKTKVLATSIYAKSKLNSEKIFTKLNSKIIILRIPSVLSRFSKKGLIYFLVKKMIKNKNIEIFNPLSLFNNVILQDDLNKIILSLIKKEKKLNKKTLLNISAEKPINFMSMINFMLKKIKSNSNIIIKVKKQKSKIYSNKAQRKLLDFRVKSVKNSINHFLDEI